MKEKEKSEEKVKMKSKKEKKTIVALKKIDENSKKFLREKMKEMIGVDLEIVETKEKESQSLEAKATSEDNKKSSQSTKK